MALLLLGIAWGVVGKDYGAPDQFWYDHPVPQFLAGIAAALLLGELCFVSFLLDTKETWLRELHKPPSPWLPRLMVRIVPVPKRENEVAYADKLRWYLSLTWLPLLICLLVPAVVHFTDRWPLASENHGNGPPHDPYLSQSWEYVVPLFRDQADPHWYIVFSIVRRWPLMVGVGIGTMVAWLFAQGFNNRP
jgi:hypothetical protein